MKLKHIPVLLVILSLILFVYYYFSKHIQAEFGILGKYRFNITDTTLLNKTYLSDDSYGFLIAQSPIPGLEIEDFDFIQNKTDLIISIKHPIKAVYTNSEKVCNESENLHSDRKPVEILKDNSINSPNYVYIYYLSPKNKYRLLLP